MKCIFKKMAANAESCVHAQKNHCAGTVKVEFICYWCVVTEMN